MFDIIVKQIEGGTEAEQGVRNDFQQVLGPLEGAFDLVSEAFDAFKGIANSVGIDL